MDLKEIEEGYFAHRPDLFRFLFSQTYDQELSEDILQDTIMEILRMHSRDIPIKSDTFRSLLYTIAFSRLRQHRKKMYQKKEDHSRDVAELFSVRRETDESELIYKTVHSVLIDGDLPERSRLLLRFRLLQELSVAEICQILKISRQTYYRDIRVGIETLRQKLTAAGLRPENME